MLSARHVSLRPLERADLSALAPFENDLELQFLSSPSFPCPRPLSDLERAYDAGCLHGASPSIEFALHASGRCVGYAGLYAIDHTARNAELGLVIGDRACWGRRFGPEALRLLLRYGFLAANLHRLWGAVHSDNERSARMCSALGLVEEGRLRQHRWVNGRFVDLVHFGILREEWRALPHALDSLNDPVPPQPIVNPEA